MEGSEVGGGGGGRESMNRAGPNLGKTELYASTQQYCDATDQSKLTIAHWISCWYRALLACLLSRQHPHEGKGAWLSKWLCYVDRIGPIPAGPHLGPILQYQIALRHFMGYPSSCHLEMMRNSNHIPSPVQSSPVSPQPSLQLPPSS